MTSTINSIVVNNPSGNTRVEILTNADGADLEIRWANNSGMSGASSFSDDITNIPSSATTIYYQLRWTEKTAQVGVYSPGVGMFDDGTFAGSQGPLSGTASNAIRWTNNGVVNNTTDISLDFFNNDIDEDDLP